MFPLHFTMLVMLPAVAVIQHDYFFVVMFFFAAAGVMLNRYVQEINGGQTPVMAHPRFDERVKLSRGHKPLTADARRPLLADVIYIKFYKYEDIVSVGDLLVWTGCVIAWFYVGILFLRCIF